MGIEVGPFDYGHVARREYNVGDIIVLDEHEKSTNDTDVIMREMWICVKGHVSSSDAMEKRMLGIDSRKRIGG